MHIKNFALYLHQRSRYRAATTGRMLRGRDNLSLSAIKIGLGITRGLDHLRPCALSQAALALTMMALMADTTARRSRLKRRCRWAGETPHMIRYHDTEWGRPVHDDRRLFEMLLLEGAQAGLSWETILRRREGYRQAFAGFDPVKVAAFNRTKRAALLRNPGIIRNRLKIDAAVSNARAFLAIQEAFGSFDAYLWQFVDGRQIVNRRMHGAEIPVTTHQSDQLSKDLRKRGFRFVGSTIIYAFMQAVGMVNDHTVDCFLAKTGRSSPRRSLGG
jgi:DNA-3-methyladenine glycosylase I